MHSDLSVFRLIWDASFVVQLIMLLLIAASVVSWSFIIEKFRVLKDAVDDAVAFEDRFWVGTDLTQLYTELAARNESLHGMEGIFDAGFKEYARLRKRTDLSPRDAVDGADRAMRVVFSREIDRLETRLPFLATVGSTSPYIGLFGTVWGIMNSFRALGATGNATLAMVAPGIAEALIATAVGLFAAIPGVIFYNRFTSEVERLATRYESFLEEFTSILQRQSHE
jgi:biopolymer transport protein TolQ